MSNLMDKGIRYNLIVLLCLTVIIYPISMRFPGTGAVKEIIQMVLVSLLLIRILVSNTIQIKSYLVLFFVVVYIVFSVFSSFYVSNINLFLDGFRYQYGYALIFLLLITSDEVHFKITDYHRVMSVLLIVVVSIGIVEFMTDEIINAIYGVKKYTLNHTELAIGSRLISSFGNPINFGAFVTFAFLSFYQLFKDKKLVVIVVFLASLFVVSFTLSRLSLIMFAVMVVFILLENVRRGLAIIFLVTVVSILLSPYLLQFVDFESIVSRTENLIHLDTYLQNLRLIHWGDVLLLNNDSIDILVGQGIGTSNPSENSGGVIVENSFISIYLDIGMIGLFLYVMIYFSVFLYIKRSKMSGKYFYYTFFILFIIISFGNDMYRNFPFVLLFWLVLSMVFNDEFNDRSIDDRI